jgi:hypothetical protein
MIGGRGRAPCEACRHPAVRHPRTPVASAPSRRRLRPPDCLPTSAWRTDINGRIHAEQSSRYAPLIDADGICGMLQPGTWIAHDGSAVIARTDAIRSTYARQAGFDAVPTTAGSVTGSAESAEFTEFTDFTEPMNPRDSLNSLNSRNRPDSRNSWDPRDPQGQPPLNSELGAWGFPEHAEHATPADSPRTPCALRP